MSGSFVATAATSLHYTAAGQAGSGSDAVIDYGAIP